MTGTLKVAVEVLGGLGSYGFWAILLVGLPVIVAYGKHHRPRTGDLALATLLFPVLMFTVADVVVWMAGGWDGFDPLFIFAGAFLAASVFWWLKRRRHPAAESA